MTHCYFSPLEQNCIYHVQQFAKVKLSNDYSGHDISHIERVVRLAKQISLSLPESNLFIVVVSAYLHDILDDKVIKDTTSTELELIQFLQQQKFNQMDQDHILQIINSISFRKNLTSKLYLSLEGKIVQDAD